MEVNAEGHHEVLHQVVRERPAGLHPFQRNGNGLGFKTAYDYGKTAKSVHFSQYHCIGMGLRDAMGKGNYFQFYLLHNEARK